jgi:hypothetical protein
MKRTILLTGTLCVLITMALATAASADVVKTFAEGKKLAADKEWPLVLDFGAKW